MKLDYYIDSKYAFLVLPGLAAVCEETGLLMHKQSSVTHKSGISADSKDVRVPKQVILMNCKGHQRDV